MNEWAGLDQRIKEFQSENERLNTILSGDPKLVHMNFTPETGLRADISHWAVRLIAASVHETLEEIGGENFVVIDLHADGERPSLEVTIRRAGKKTTAEVLAELRKENKDLKETLEYERDKESLGSQAWLADRRGQRLDKIRELLRWTITGVALKEILETELLGGDQK